MAQNAAVDFTDAHALFASAEKLCGEYREALNSVRTKISKITGNLRVSKEKNRFKYYLITEKGDTHGTFATKQKMRTVQAIAQRDYHTKLEAFLTGQIHLLESFTQSFVPAGIDSVCEALHPGRRAVIAPVRLPEVEFVEQWKAAPYKGKSVDDVDSEFYTSTNIRVRSKSEVIIADTLTRLGIPFRYEAPQLLKVKGAVRTFYPDFTCLNVRSRSEIVWEHFGMMDCADYAENAAQKIALYVANGYSLGKNFIASFETSGEPLSVKKVQKYVKDYFA